MNKILVANRGEIALRVIRSAREMGIKTVAIYSEVDRLAPFVKMSDEAAYIGPAPSGESYLKIDKIIEVAKARGVEGIHPGYGFLSENPEFAQKVEDAGVRFIGPPGKSIEIMGDKLASKAAVQQYDIPLLPGTDEALEDVNKAKDIAQDTGYPILIKAAAGGGGKGMRIVETEGDLEEQMDRAVSEAKTAFGNGAVFIEKYIGSPRHVEIQILGDQYGNFVYFFERECSIQRRHQKVIEEAPCPIVDEQMRQNMGESAIGVAKSCGYVGAGTVEFLVDEHKNFYFLEMNTRLQVEHPITEMVTGVDLAKEQIKVARGEKLRFQQKDLSLSGHSVELRLYAEDPANNFLPDIGTLTTFKPADGPGVRTDSGYEEGQQIPVYYDPMIAKLVVHDQTREMALNKMIRAIDDFQLDGIASTLGFGKYVMNHEGFRKGDYDTHFVKNHFTPAKLQEPSEEEAQIAGMLSVQMLDQEQSKEKAKLSGKPSNHNNWRTNRQTY